MVKAVVIGAGLRIGAANKVLLENHIDYRYAVPNITDSTLNHFIKTGLCNVLLRHL